MVNIGNNSKDENDPSPRFSSPNGTSHGRILGLVETVILDVEVRLPGPKLVSCLVFLPK